MKILKTLLNLFNQESKDIHDRYTDGYYKRSLVQVKVKRKKFSLKPFKSWINSLKRECYNCKYEDNRIHHGVCHGCYSTRGLHNFVRKVEG